MRSDLLGSDACRADEGSHRRFVSWRVNVERTTELDLGYINQRARLPYGLTVAEVQVAVAETYRLLHGLNDYLVGSGFRPLEELLLGNSFSSNPPFPLTSRRRAASCGMACTAIR